MPDRNNYLSYLKRTTNGKISISLYATLSFYRFYANYTNICHKIQYFPQFHIHFTFLFPASYFVKEEKKIEKKKQAEITSTSLVVHYILINVVQKKGVRNIKETLDILLLSFRITRLYRRKQQTYLALNDLYVVMLCDVGMLPKWYAVCCIECGGMYTVFVYSLKWCIIWRLNQHIIPLYRLNHFFSNKPRIVCKNKIYGFKFVQSGLLNFLEPHPARKFSILND